MNIDLVIDANSTEVSIALLKNGILTEWHKEKGSDDFSVGDIYLGKVRRVVPSLNAAFVDVGYEKDAFLHYLDLGQQFQSLNKFTKSILKGDFRGTMLGEGELEQDIEKEGKIKDVLSSGQQILVQIAKEPISQKGPRLCSELTLAGRYLVLVPFSNKVSISQKIRQPGERDRLRQLMHNIRPKNFGVIIRTVAENKKVSDLENDLNDLITRWETVAKNLRNSAPPKRVLGEINKTSAVLRDLLSPHFSNIHVNNRNLYTQVREYIRNNSPEKENIVRMYTGNLPIFENYGVHKQIKAAFGRQVMLRSGAYLIVEHTEAMHVIDVNSGNRKGMKDQEQNALETNLEAADEIARIIRLRDMGGIIAIDFIDMAEGENQRKLYEHLKEAMKLDKAKHNVLPPSKFGVVEITRQRVRPETDITTTESCPVCKGSGEVEATVLLTDEIENTLEYVIKEMNTGQVAIKVHPYLESYLKRKFFSFQRKWFMQYKKWIPVKADSSYHLLKYEFIDSTGRVLEV
ncbi:MAG TPA: Rne/Rng family ribonuclease [Luteibaculaceae bacterium]|nr:Rne/Rng family ribonuclease [Luteibaculaceae bacterium]